LLQMKFQDITHPDDLEVELPQLDKMRAGLADTYSREKRYIRKDGSVVWVGLRVSTVRGPDRRVKRFIVVIQDISVRREAEQAKYRLAAIVESSDDAIVSKNLNGIIASWNAGAQRIFEFTPEEAVGQPITIIIPPELHDEERQIIKRLRNGERIEHYETVRVTKSGKKINISLTVSPMKDSTGRIVGASKIARDVTESKRIERALREGEARLRAAFSQTYSFLILLSPDGTIIEVNRAALEASGLERRIGSGRMLFLFGGQNPSLCPSHAQSGPGRCWKSGHDRCHRTGPHRAEGTARKTGGAGQATHSGARGKKRGSAGAGRNRSRAFRPAAARSG